MIDISFNMYSDAKGGDPDATSPILRAYHKRLWSKPLPSGDLFDLRDDKPGYYLYHNSALATLRTDLGGCGPSLGGYNPVVQKHLVVGMGFNQSRLESKRGGK
jgi:hypothetical protein